MKRFDFIKVKNFGDGSGLLWAVFPAKYSDERLRKFIMTHAAWADSKPIIDQPIKTMDDCERYSGAGQYFTRKLGFYRQGSRVLVSQGFGWDI